MIFSFRLPRVVVVALAALSLFGVAFAEPYEDPVFGFKVTPPEGWASEHAREGQDSVLRFQSPDGNAYGEVRALVVEAGTTAEMLMQAYQQVVIPEAELAGRGADRVGDLEGLVAAWRTGEGGQSVVVGGFFAVRGEVGYVLMTLTAESLFETYSPVYDAAFATFAPGMPGAQSQPDTRKTPPPAPDVTPDLHAGLVAQSHPELGFVIVHRDNWVADQPESYSVRLAPRGVPLAQAPTITVEALAGEAYVSLQDFAGDLKAQLAEHQDVTIDQEGPHRVDSVAVDGVPLEAWSFGAHYTKDGAAFRGIFYLFERPEPHAFYGVYASGPLETLLKYQEDMMPIMATFEMIPFGE